VTSESCLANSNSAVDVRLELKYDIEVLVLCSSGSAFVLLSSVASEASDEFLGSLFAFNKSVTSALSGSKIAEWISHAFWSPHFLVFDSETNKTSGDWRLPVRLRAANSASFPSVDQPGDLLFLWLVEQVLFVHCIVSSSQSSLEVGVATPVDMMNCSGAVTVDCGTEVRGTEELVA
jgi:hypothetical protein